MPLAVTPSLLARLTGQRRRGRRQPEPADLGTAFGMEQWLDERDQGGLSATTAATPAPATAAKRTWLPRWLQNSATP